MAIDRPVKADESCCRGWELGFESEAEAREAAACINLFPLAVEMLRWVRSYVDGGEEAFYEIENFLAEIDAVLGVFERKGTK